MNIDGGHLVTTFRKDGTMVISSNGFIDKNLLRLRGTVLFIMPHRVPPLAEGEVQVEGQPKPGQVVMQRMIQEVSETIVPLDEIRQITIQNAGKIMSPEDKEVYRMVGGINL